MATTVFSKLREEYENTIAVKILEKLKITENSDINQKREAKPQAEKMMQDFREWMDTEWAKIQQSKRGKNIKNRSKKRQITLIPSNGKSKEEWITKMKESDLASGEPGKTNSMEAAQNK